MVQPNKPSEVRDVTIIRSGYATDDLWRAAITTAVLHGHQVKAITADGTAEIPPAGRQA